MDRYLISTRLSALNLAGAQLVAATAITAFALPVTQDWHVPQWRLDASISLAALGILGTGVAYVLNYRIIADDGASAASLVTYLLPVTALILGAVVLQEKPTAHAVVGMLAILTGVALARRGMPVRMTTSPPAPAVHDDR
jgi:drug/metabolite transporter (DMT)-like permease